MQRDYYCDATQEKPDGAKSLEHYGRFGTDYSKNVSAAVKPGDYVVPSKDANTLGRYTCLMEVKFLLTCFLLT